MPRVSVIIPTYNHRDFVLQALDSVFAQTFTDYEIIVINDGSPDDTAQLLAPLAQAARIRNIEQSNAGQSAARNRGISMAGGEYIAFLDDDDLWPADHLQWQVDALDQDPAAVMVYGTFVFLSSGEGAAPAPVTPSGDPLNDFTRNPIISPGQTLIRKSAIDRLGGLDSSIRGADDWDLYLGLARQGRFCFRDHVALKYRAHASNASRNFYSMYRNGQRVIAKHFTGSGVLDVQRRRQAIRFIKDYAWGNCRQVIHQDRRQRKYLAIAWAAAQLLWIYPELIFSPRLFQRVMNVILPGAADDGSGRLQ